MFSLFFNIATSRLGFLFGRDLLLRFYLFLRAIIGKSLQLDLSRLKTATAFRVIDRKAGSFNKKIELIFVSTDKDFSLLPLSIKAGLRSVSHYEVSGVRVIVPDKSVLSCNKILSALNLEKAIKVIAESNYVTQGDRKLLIETFGERANWVMQQVLKVNAVLDSKADGSLIIDSDTVLLRKRSWFDTNGKQLLQPSFEYNLPYYQFLKKLNICSSNPKYTFISHHMLMQSHIFRAILSKLGFKDMSSFIQFTCENADLSTESPVCIEYELYAQGLLKFFPNEFFLGSWSNVSIRRTFFGQFKTIFSQRMLSFLFNSASFHSWSE